MSYNLEPTTSPICYSWYMKKNNKKSRSTDGDFSLSRLYVDRYFRAGIVLLLLTILVVIYGSKASYPLTLTHQANDILVSQDQGSVLTTAQAYLMDIQPRYILIGLLGVSALCMFMAATTSRRGLEKATTGKVSPQRWIYRGFTGLLLVEILGLISGISDVSTIKLMGGLMFSWGLVGLASEQYLKVAKKPSRLLFYVGVGVSLLAVLPIALSAFGTEQYGLERAGWHVYASYVVFLGWGVANLINQWRQINRTGDWKDYSFVNRNYYVQGFISYHLHYQLSHRSILPIELAVRSDECKDDDSSTILYI